MKITHDKVRNLCLGCQENSFDTSKAGDNYKEVNDKIGYNESQETWSISTKQIPVDNNNERYGRRTNLYVDSGDGVNPPYYLWPNTINHFHTLYIRNIDDNNFTNVDIYGYPTINSLNWKNILPSIYGIRYNLKNAVEDYIKVNSIDDILNGASSRYIFVPIYTESPSPFQQINYTSVRTGWQQNYPCSDVYEDTTYPSLRDEYFNDISPGNITGTAALINSRIGVNCCGIDFFGCITDNGLGLQIPWLTWLTWVKGYEAYPPPARDACFNPFLQIFCCWSILPRFLYYGIETALNNPYDDKIPIYRQVPEYLPLSIQYGYLLDITSEKILNHDSWRNFQKVKITTTRTTHVVVVNDTRDTKWLNGWLGIPNFNGVPDFGPNLDCSLQGNTQFYPNGITNGLIPDLDDLYNSKITEFNDISQITITLDGVTYPWIDSIYFNLDGGVFYTYDTVISSTDFSYCSISDDGEILYTPDVKPTNEIISTIGSYNIYRSVPNITCTQVIDEITSNFTGVSVFDPTSLVSLPILPDWGISLIEYSTLSYFKTLNSDDKYEPMIGPYYRYISNSYVNPNNPTQDILLEYCGQPIKEISFRPISIVDILNGTTLPYSTETVNGWISVNGYQLYCPHNQKEINCFGLTSAYEINEGKACDDLIFTGSFLKEIHVGDITSIKIIKSGNKNIYLDEYENPTDKDRKDFTGTTLIDLQGNTSETLYYIPSSVQNLTPVIRTTFQTAQSYFGIVEGVVNNYSPIYYCDGCDLGEDSTDEFLIFDFLYPSNGTIYTLLRGQENFKAAKNVLACQNNYAIKELRGFAIGDAWFDSRYNFSCAIKNIYGEQYTFSFGIREFTRDDMTVNSWSSTNNLFNILSDATITHFGGGTISNEVFTPLNNNCFLCSFGFTINAFGRATLTISSVWGDQTLFAISDTICNNANNGYIFNGTWPVYTNDIRGGYSVISRQAVFNIVPKVFGYSMDFLSIPVANESKLV